MTRNPSYHLRCAATILAVLLSLFLPVMEAAAKTLHVMTSTEDLASLAREVGGQHANVESIARGYQDPHYVEAKPSFLLKLQKADLLIVVGLGLESGWLPPLITQSRNSRIQVGGAGNLDASAVAVILEKPSGPVTRAMGDVHPLGNPHYWLDPENGRRIARAIADRLAQLDPEDAAYFQQRYQDFNRRLQEASKRWEQDMVPIKGTEVITYHNSWPSFTEHFGLRVGGFVEPKPGIPPSPAHTLEVISQIKKDQIKLILVEPYFDLKTPNAIAHQTGSKVLVMLPSVGGVPAVTTYLQLFDYNIRLLKGALAAQR
ncbi:MAG: zinc ABC transporter substrate-binding protein [Acidobacteria bacterium]|nr:zinc ABC transporter substrate-binding protein [Acidobacteriota bacterium]